MRQSCLLGGVRSSNLTVEQNGSDTVTALMNIAFKAGYNVACGIETVNDPSFCIEHMSIRINHQTAKCEVIVHLHFDDCERAAFDFPVKLGASEFSIKIRVYIVVEAVDRSQCVGGKPCLGDGFFKCISNNEPLTT